MGNASTNTSGRAVKQLIDSGIVCHTPTLFDTWISPVGVGKPDIMLTNNNDFLNIAVSAGPHTTSDHIPIVIKLATSPIMLPSSPRFNFNKANWESFRQELNNRTNRY